VENDIARARLEKTYLMTNIKQLETQSKEYNDQILEKNQIITRSEQEIKRRVILIEQKQNQIDLMNKKLENLKEKAGGIELGPFELEILNLQKTIAQVGKDIFDLEQTWLRGQNELVHLTNEKDNLEKETDSMKLKYTILMSRKLRTESKSNDCLLFLKNIGFRYNSKYGN
jgi:chromosome segregation ATPase